MFEVCDGGGGGELTRATVDGEDLMTRGGLGRIATGATGFCGIGWRRAVAIVVGAGATGTM
jgi:hypothetical protein